MVNASALTQSPDLNIISNWFSSTSESIAQKLVNFLLENGINVSVRWTSLLILFVSLFIIFIGMRISKPIIKWLLIVIGILLAFGTILPW